MRPREALGLFLVLAALGCGSTSSQDEERPVGEVAAPEEVPADQDADGDSALPGLALSGDDLSDGVSLLRRGQVQEAIDLLEQARATNSGPVLKRVS